jgi:hypothetical protein
VWRSSHRDWYRSAGVDASHCLLQIQLVINHLILGEIRLLIGIDVVVEIIHDASDLVSIQRTVVQ